MRIINPSTDTVLAELAEDSPGSIAEKVQRARAAQPAWAREPYENRAAAITRFRQAIVDQTEMLAVTLTREVGKPVRQSKNELAALLGRIDFFLENSRRELADEVVFQDAAIEERIGFEPLGAIVNVSAWNYPYFVGANVFVPALLTGNAVLYKPSELATMTGLAIAKLLHESGVPEDVFIPVIGEAQVGSALIQQRIDGVFFTGSVSTGRKIAAAVAPRLAKLQLELGGKDPVYVTNEVDVAMAAAAVADGAFYNTGQSCCAVERVYVHRSIWEPFIERFCHEVQGFKLGDPLDPETYIGPMARRGAQIAHLERQIADARAKGANVLTGGKRAAGRGYFFEPTVLVDVNHDMDVMREESFGPIIGLMPVDSDEEAIRLMNDTEYGLTAGVYGANRGRAETVLRQLDVGTAYWNCCDRVSPRLPWSGRRDSGVGCTLSTYGIEAFVKPKAWHLRTG
jgi:acyl-CoA reductase-like NAD-dependent aldehyde dehydrogenase